MKKIILPLMIFLSTGTGLVQGKSEWQEERSEHFFIYYKKAPLDFVKNVERMAEQYYREISEDLGFTRYSNWTYDRRAKIYIYDDQEDYLTSAQQFQWSHGVASAEAKEIRTFPAAHGFFDSVLPHELGHIIFREFVGFDAQIPLWLDEGVAMYQEKAKRWGANTSVQKAIQDGKFIPVEDLMGVRLFSDTPSEVVELFYAEAASLVYFMITELEDFRFANFCRKLKEGSTFDNALSIVYSRIRNRKGLNDAWVKYLKDMQ